MGSSKKDMSTGGGGHSSTILTLRPLEAHGAHMQGALKAIWAAIAPKGRLTREEFTKFLTEVQKEKEPDDIAKILASVLPAGEGGNSLGIAEFFKYMCSPAANALRLPKPSERDTSHPLTSYFISSSHNTYLVGHQLYGDSTTAGYVNVLRRGCRCIEIDVWDGDDGEPEVFHGWTLTKEISFVEVCKAIRDHAFWEEGGEKVDGPVVISLECHCSEAQQIKMVKIMKDVWKGILVEGPICGAKSVHEVDKVPTLEQLRGKILVKTKYHPPDPVADAASQGLSRLSLDSSQQQRKIQQSGAPPRRAKTNPSASRDSTTSDSSSDEELLEYARQNNRTKPKKTKITRALSDLAIYIGATHFPGTFTPATPFRATTVFSFSEKVFANHYATWPKELFHHNLKHFMRVYPFGLRFSSSNADPTIFWRRGVQLVALNWQKADEGMMLNEGMFAGEGGYVLKPPHFRPGPQGTPPPDPPARRSLDLEIEVLAAQSIPLPEDDDKPASFEPYVKIELHVDDPVIEGDEVKARTKTAANKGIDATWEPKKKLSTGKRLSRKLFSSSKSTVEDDGVLGEENHVVEKKSKRIGEVVKFKQIYGVRCPEMCFVRIRVHDEEFGRDDLAAWACIRLDRLKPGWRIVRLFDRKGRGSGGILVVRVGWRLN